MKIELSLSWDQLKQLTGLNQDSYKKKFPALFSEDGELKEDADLFPSISQAVRTKMNDFGDQKWKSSREALEVHLKAVGIEDFDKAEDGLAKLAERLKGDPDKGADGELTDEKVKNHPVYLAAVKTLKEKNEALQKEYNDHKVKVETEGKQATRKAEMLRLLKSDDIKAGFGAKGEDLAMQAFLSLYPNYYIANGKIVDEKGQPVQDEDHNEYTAVDFLKKNWLFGLNVAPGGDTPPPPGQGSQGGAGTFKITSKAHYEQLYEQHVNDSKKLEQLQNDWMAYLSQNPNIS